MSFRFVRSPAAPKMTITHGGATLASGSGVVLAMSTFGLIAARGDHQISCALPKESFPQTCAPAANENAYTEPRSKLQPGRLLQVQLGSSNGLRLSPARSPCSFSALDPQPARSQSDRAAMMRSHF